jgi:hypothetical protein
LTKNNNKPTLALASGKRGKVICLLPLIGCEYVFLLSTTNSNGKLKIKKLNAKVATE